MCAGEKEGRGRKGGVHEEKRGGEGCVCGEREVCVGKGRCICREKGEIYVWGCM